MFLCIVEDGLQYKDVLHNAIGSSEKALLDSGVNNAVDREIIFKAFSKDLVVELSYCSGLDNGSKILGLRGVTPFGEENDICRAPVGWGLMRVQRILV